MQTENAAIYSSHPAVIDAMGIQEEKQNEEREEVGEKRRESYAELGEISSVDAEAFRRVLATFGSGVTIVTLCYEKLFYGLTVSSFCSLSLEPPLVLIGVNRCCQSHDLIRMARAFTVNILAEGSEWLATRFASQSNDKFAQVAYHQGKMEAPLLDDALATIECRLVHQFPGGDHSIFVGNVLAATISHDVPPLLYYRSHFHRIAR